MHLYEILPAVSKMEELAEDNEQLIPYLDGAKLTLNEKVDNIVKLNQGLEGSQLAIDNEIKRLSELKASFNRKARNLKEYVSYQMLKNDIKKIETNIAKISFRKSTQVEIENIDLIPEDFKNRKEVVTVDKMKIKKAIESGEEIDGATIKTFNNLQIK